MTWNSRGVYSRMLPSPAAVDDASGLVALFESEVMVEVEVDRLKVFASGAKCVSLSSVHRQMRTYPETSRHTLCDLPRHDNL